MLSDFPGVGVGILDDIIGIIMHALMLLVLQSLHAVYMC